MTTVHHTPPPGAPPFAIYEDPEDQEPPSPSDVYEGDISFISETSLPNADEAIPSIEQEVDDEPEPYRSSYTSRPSLISNAQSRRVSGMTTTSFISELPSELSIASKPKPPTSYEDDTRYTPRKERPPFRNPSSVRAMQMSSPPPFASFESPRERLKGQYKLATPSRSGRSETPVSATRSRRASHRSSHHGDAHAQQSPRPTPTPQQHLPLVLLHVTILPMQVPYSDDLMRKAMPHWLLENYKLLAEKLEDIVLMRRGMLIPHPREEYDVLEETILESLELKTPRLLKCGHFVGSEEDDNEHEESEEEEGSVFMDDNNGRGSRMSGGTLTVDEDGEMKHSDMDHDASLCLDCHRQVKKPGKGIGLGNKKWDIKIYAANGLMRAGAWSAAWREMERCDVEISPWMPENVRKAIERKADEEQEAETQRLLQEAEIQRRIEEETARLKQLELEAEEKRRQEEGELRKKIEAAAVEAQRKLAEEEAERKRLDDAFHEKIEEAKETMRLEFEAQSLAESDSVAVRFRALEEKLRLAEAMADSKPPSIAEPMLSQTRHQSRGRPRSASRHPAADEVPLGTLLKNYIVLLARDQRNFAILILGVLVVFMATHMSPTISQSSGLPNVLPSEAPLKSVSQVYVTTTATTTATAVSTTTVTHVEPPRAEVAKSIAPSLAAILSSSEAAAIPANSISELTESPSVKTSGSASATPSDSTSQDVSQEGTVEDDGTSSPSQNVPSSSITEDLLETPGTGIPASKHTESGSEDVNFESKEMYHRHSKPDSLALAGIGESHEEL